MKKLLFILNLLVLFFSTITASHAANSKYLLMTSGKDIEFKKKKALDWYKNKVDNEKFYCLDANKEVAELKSKALRWYDSYVTNGKFYFVKPDKEIAIAKNRALRWYERNHD